MILLANQSSPSRHVKEQGPSQSRRLRDARVLGAVRQFLRGSTYKPLAALHVTVHDGAVSLAGVVSSWHLKQLAQELVMAVPGVKAVCNDVEVRGE